MPPKKRTRSPTGITTTTDASTTSTSTTTDLTNKKEYYFVGLRDKELQELIIKSGGSIVTSVTNTVIVVCKAGEENTKKVQDSAALGAQLVTREDLKNQLHDPTADPATKKQAVEDPNPPKSTRGRKPAAASVPVPVAVAAPAPVSTTPDPATTTDPAATTTDPNAPTTSTSTTAPDPSSTSASTTTPDPNATSTASSSSPPPTVTTTTTVVTTTTTTSTTTSATTPVVAPALDPEAEKLYPGGVVVVDGSNVFEAFLTKPDGRKKIPIYVTLQLIHIPKKGRKKEFYTTFTKTSDSTEDVTEDIVSSTLEDGKAQFEALFLLKTGNKWSDRNSFTPKKGSFVISSTPPPNPTAAQAAAAAAAASAPPPAPAARRGRSATNSLPPARPSTPSPPPSPKAKRGRKAANAPVLATLPTGAPALVSTPSTTQAGCIDAVAKTLLPDADVVVHAGDIYDVALAQVDVSTNTDKYYIIQVLVSAARRQPNKYYVFLRWGRTGSNGQNQLHGAYSTLAEAIEVFEDKFHEKTDNDWSARKSFVKKKGFYELLRVDHANKASRRLGTTPVAKWEYYVDDHVDGKATGWYEYTADGAAETEELWVTYQSNPHMSQRVVESGKFSYLVDLGKMTQVNVSHPARKVRNIRRNYHGVITQGATTTTSTSTIAASSLIAAAPVPVVIPAPIAPVVKPVVVAKASTPAAPAASTPSGPVVRPVDNNCPLSSRGSVSVVDNYDIMLNQADIKANKNKFYRIQLLFNSADSNYYFWTRWGRVGEIGQSNLDNCGRDKNAGIAAFKKKFKDKTSERWEDGPPYTPRSGKYEVIDMKFGASAPPPLALVSASGIVPPSKLDDKTRQLMEIIFDTDMFKSAMTDIKVDLTRMPLGAITVSQLEKGYAVLKEIEALLTKPSLNSRERDHLISLSGNFYQVIPHSYARSTRPPPIDSNELLSEKLNMINTLKDIEVAQSVLGNASSAGSITENPIDAKYRQLDADLELLDPNSPDYALITTFMDQTLGHYKRNVKLYDIWKVRRHPEDTTFPAFESIDNHHLLWHGTNIAVVAAILKTGLRIMPAVNGGRVGRGIYLADKLEKSVSYVRPTRRPDGTQFGIAFLAQAAMGRVKEITRDDGSLVAAPSGYDSVIARGREEPDPAARTTFKIDGKYVTIHQGGMVQTGVTSSFSQNEYLVYRESQQRLRYVISFKI